MNFLDSKTRTLSWFGAPKISEPKAPPHDQLATKEGCPAALDVIAYYVQKLEKDFEYEGHVKR
jgi:hypothetical protein